MTKAATLTDRRAALADALEATTDAQDAARHRQRTARSEAAHEALTPLQDFYRAIEFGRPGATPESERADRLAELTAALFEDVKAGGLVLKPVRSTEGFALAVADPAIDADYTAALAAKNAAAAELRSFEEANADALTAERKATTAVEVKAALDSGDPAAIRTALARRDDEDERTAKQRTADALVSGSYENWDADGQGDIRRSAPAHETALTTADLPG